jgi:hypothetical protein
LRQPNYRIAVTASAVGGRSIGDAPYGQMQARGPQQKLTLRDCDTFAYRVGGWNFAGRFCDGKAVRRVSSKQFGWIHEISCCRMFAELLNRRVQWRTRKQPPGNLTTVICKPTFAHWRAPFVHNLKSCSLGLHLARKPQKEKGVRRVIFSSIRPEANHDYFAEVPR